MPQALVTGGRGFIGSQLVRTLVRGGWQVRVLDLPTTPHDALQGVEHEFYGADITDPQSFGAAFKGVDAVFHLAAIPRDWGPAKLFFAVNRDGTRNVLQAAIDAGVERFVQMSSLAVHKYRPYFEADENAPCDATYPPYATSKIAAERIVRDYQDRGLIQTTIVRPGMVIFGPWDRMAFVPMVDALRKGQFGFVNGGRGRFCYSYVENLTAGMVRAAKSEEAAGGTFVLADDGAISWREYATAICDALDFKQSKLSLPYPLLVPLAGAMHLGAHLVRSKAGPPLTLYRIKVASCDLHWSNAHAKQVFGYDPTVGFAQGLQRTIDWYREHYPTG
ncbi:MAG: NAD-dependent epimerase/dehydratase family protein [Candidatus Alcyoniella australis]|nr:NAD-dependent epimerase/dehydratase family protein [Candidatus Alcyoniella australis]